MTETAPRPLSVHKQKTESVRISTFDNTATDNEAELAALLQNVSPVPTALQQAARNRLDNLTKPKGSLGKLEDMAVRICCIQGKEHGISPDPLRVYAIAGDHGVNEEGVSVFPQDVTRQMVINFCEGGAGINILANTAGAELCVVDLASKGGNYPDHPSLIQCKIAQGTKNITKAPAMSREQCIRAILIGAALADKAQSEGCPAVGTGEMGVSNTTPSTALYCAFLGLMPEEITGAGGGLDAEGIARKARVVKRALTHHKSTIDQGDPIDILAAIGGYEIAALTGLILGGAANKQLVLLDGFISTAAYAAAWKLCPHVHDYAFFSHASAEAGHKKILTNLDINPLHDLGLRLGEGSGVPLALFLLRCACNTYNNMATYEDANVEPPDNLQ